MPIALRAIFAACLILAARPAFAGEIGITPAQIGQAFCIARLTGDDGAIAGLLSPSLSSAIAAAEEKDAAWAKANPGEKPPLGDGIPWSSFVDYASECEVGEIKAEAKHADVEIRYRFPEAPDANYSDWLALERVERPALQGPAWRIDNVAYVEAGDLKAMLVDAFAAP